MNTLHPAENLVDLLPQLIEACESDYFDYHITIAKEGEQYDVEIHGELADGEWDCWGMDKNIQASEAQR